MENKKCSKQSIGGTLKYKYSAVRLRVSYWEELNVAMRPVQNKLLA